jgi:Tfp pilus assembly protein PilZ
MQTARLAERAPFSARVDVVPHGTPTALSVWCQDLSETGMFVQTTESFMPGDLLSLRFEVDGQPVHVRAAEVVWVRRFEPINVDGRLPGLGLRFVSIDPPARAALRRAVQRGRPEVVQATMSRAKKSTSSPPAMAPTGESAGPALPTPMLTLPPLSRSIIEASGARDLEDTQDLLPPAALHRTPPDGVTFSQLPFRALDVSLPPDEPNLSAEARVFDGVPPTPRAVSLAPEASPRTPPVGPRAVTLGPRPASSTPSMTSGPPRQAITQKLFTLPPVDAVDRLEASTLPMPTLATMSMIESLPPASPEVQALMGQPSPSSSSSSELPAPPPLDPFAGWSFRKVEAAVAPAPTVAADAGPPEIENPSILEAVSLPPTLVPSLVPTAAVEVSDGYSLGGALSVAPSDGEPRFAPLRDAKADAFRDDGRDLAVKHLPLERDTLQDERRPARAPVRRRRSAFGPAVAVLALGCAAGAAVALLPSPLSSSPASSPVAAPSVAAVVPAAAPVEAAPRPVDVVEAELRGPAASAPAALETAKVAEAAPAPVEIAPAAGEAPKVEPRADLTPQPPLQRPGEGEPERKTRVETAQVEPAKVETAKVEPSKVETAKVEAKVEEPVLASTTRAAKAALGGRHAVALPEGGTILKTFALGDPARVVVDLEGAILPGAAISVGEGGVEAVRFGRPAPGTQRVVVVLDGAGKPDAVEARLDDDRLIVSWQY